MDDLITLSCPSCGASLEVASGIKQFSCEYCGNTHVVLNTLPDEISSHARNKANFAQGRLMDYFDFKMEDLQYNRRGKLSPYQERRFFVEGITSFLLFLAGGLLSTIFIIARTPLKQAVGCSSISIIVFMIFGIISYQRLMRHVEAGVVQSETGSLGKPPRATLKPVFYIGHESFWARDNPFMVLEWNVPYRVYFIPKTHRVLSIELLNP